MAMIPPTARMPGTRHATARATAEKIAGLAVVFNIVQGLLLVLLDHLRVGEYANGSKVSAPTSSVVNKCNSPSVNVSFSIFKSKQRPVIFLYMHHLIVIFKGEKMQKPEIALRAA